MNERSATAVKLTHAFHQREKQSTERDSEREGRGSERKRENKRVTERK